jgi:protein-S-isoprenylcysteine O-methyltransferase Ste14
LIFVVNLVDVRDAAEGLILAMERGRPGQRYVLGGESMPLRRVLEIMAEISGRRVRCIHVNGKVAEMVTGALEFISDHVTHRPPSGTAEGVRIALRAGALSIEKAQRELGYAPGPVEPVLRETIAHLLGRRPGSNRMGLNAAHGLSTVSRRTPVRRLIEWQEDGPRHAERSWSMVRFCLEWLDHDVAYTIARHHLDLMGHQLGRGVVLVRSNQEHVMTADSLKYRLPIIAGAVLFMPLAGKVLGEKPLWQFGNGGVYVLACLVLAGISFTWWARIHLGRFWSNAITHKEGHQVIDTGPYGLVRHPIYTGLIAGMLVTGFAVGTVTAILGAALISLGMGLKARMEEGFLTAELGADAYGSYCRRVPMLIPFLRPT